MEIQFEEGFNPKYSETYEIMFDDKEEEKQFIKYMVRYRKEFDMFNQQLDNGEYIIIFYDDDYDRLYRRTERFIICLHRKNIKYCNYS